MAKVIEQVNRPALVMAHNKTLAAQLYHEFKSSSRTTPSNTSSPTTTITSRRPTFRPATFTSRRKRRSTTSWTSCGSRPPSLFERRDCIIVASVSCIYGLGSPEAYYGMLLFLEKGQKIKREGDHRASWSRFSTSAPMATSAAERSACAAMSSRSSHLRRQRLPHRAVGRRGRVAGADRSALRHREAEVSAPAHLSQVALRDEAGDARSAAVDSILQELAWWEKELEKQGRIVEAQRVHQRTRFDLEMIKEMGYCHGIENYSRHFTGRLPGEPPPTLLDYVPRDYLLFIDESHQTIPQVHGMWHGDRSRKQNLIDYGFRLPSALDNRPLTFEEFERG
jgi:excinuclease ABC subunit B